jgi:hypothetical protein
VPIRFTESCARYRANYGDYGNDYSDHHSITSIWKHDAQPE